MGVWIGRTLMAMYALCAVPFILGIAVVVGIVLLGTVGLITVWMERSFRRGGMYETDAGLRIVTGWGSKTVPWADIASFRPAAKGHRGRVLLVGTNGVISPITGLAQGARICWRGGETRDIVAVLNARLDDWRGAHPPAPSWARPR